MSITISDIIKELELMNPDDLIGILDITTKHVYQIDKVIYNPDIGAFIFIPDIKERLIASSMLAKQKLQGESNGKTKKDPTNK